MNKPKVKLGTTNKTKKSKLVHTSKNSAKDKAKNIKEKDISINRNNENDRLIKREIIGILFIALSLFLILLVYKLARLGIIGNIFLIFFRSTFGKGMYIFPYIVAFLGILQFLNVLSQNKKKQYISVIGIFTCIIMLITISDIINNNIFNSDNGLINIIKFSINNKSPKIYGGGIIGNILTTISIRLFGNIGTYIFTITLFFVNIVLFTNQSVISFLKIMFKPIKKISKLFYKFLIVEEDVSKLNSKKSSGNFNNKDIKIIDYNFCNNDIKNLQNNSITDMKIDGYNNNSSKIDKEKKEILKEGLGENVAIGKNNKIKLLHNDVKEKLKNNKKIDNDDKVVKREQIKIVDLKDTSTENNDTINNYILPDSSLLKSAVKKNYNIKDDLKKDAEKLISTLNSFNISCTITQISKGPTITRYEIQPAPGIKVSRITSLQNDIALNLATSDIRIEAPIPGKSAVGIEVPNKHKTNVLFKTLVDSKEFKNVNTNVPFALGKDIAGKNIIGNIEKMPHLLVAGATGSGKSVCINTLIMSILFKSKPDEVKLILIDPKVVELSIYNGIPHLLIPVVTDPRKASNALNWAVSEMTIRYKLFAQNSVRNISSYNAKMLKENRIEEKIPQIVIIIDELADLMQVAPGEVEESITRIAQLARACGIHLVIATQRPSVDIITGTIKANIPSRIAFAVSSSIDSRTILDTGGAEKLLGKGDMLYHPIGIPKPIRIQGTFISDDEIKEVVEYIKNQNIKQKINDINEKIEKKSKIDEKVDELLEDAIKLVVCDEKASASYLQRKFSIGYNRAARLIDSMEERGIISSRQGNRPRKILISAEELEQKKE